MRHAGHFVRLLALVAIAVVGFLFVRSKVIPDDYGVKGHYRLSAIADEAAREPRHLGSEACAECHDDIAAEWTAGKHTTPQCENCHGPGLLHIKKVSDDSTAGYPDKILTQYENAINRSTGIHECRWCHLKTFERPSTLKSIASVEQHVTEHKGAFSPDTKCIDCHNPHTAVAK